MVATQADASRPCRAGGESAPAWRPASRPPAARGPVRSIPIEVHRPPAAPQRHPAARGRAGRSKHHTAARTGQRQAQLEPPPVAEPTPAPAPGRGVAAGPPGQVLGALLTRRCTRRQLGHQRTRNAALRATDSSSVTGVAVPERKRQARASRCRFRRRSQRRQFDRPAAAPPRASRPPAPRRTAPGSRSAVTEPAPPAPARQ